MKKRRRVFLYGKTVILGTVGASLRGYADLEVIPLSAPLPGMHALDALSPDVILFDLQADRPEAAFALLGVRPDLLLVGIDPSSDQVLMWGGRQLSSVSTQELVQAITKSASDYKE
jgi:hypothetical protein